MVQQFLDSSSPTLPKRLVPRPPSQHGSQSPYSQTQHSLGSLPLEIFIAVAGLLRSDDLLNFSVTSSQFRTLLLPVMYHTVALESSKACLSGLAMLHRRPHLCIYIHDLIVRPNHWPVCWPRTDALINETKAAFMIQQLAGDLKHLEKFVWGGNDLPSDYLWIALRRSCPQLKKVSSTASSINVEPGCELFKFEDLAAFSFTVPVFQKDINSPGLPVQLVDMLLYKCPNLEELTLNMLYAWPILPELGRLLTGVFPKLRVLHLEIWCASEQQPSSSAALGSFLAAHPQITALSIFPSGETQPLMLPSSALSRLTTFLGVYKHITELPNPHIVERLDLMGTPLLETDVIAVSGTLRQLTSLRCLDIRLAGPSILRALLPACSALTTLRVMFPVNFGMKFFKQISTSLQTLPHLRFFTLYKGHRLTWPSMLACALLFLSDNPHLREIHFSWFAFPRFTRSQNGDYVVCEDGCGMQFVDVHERGVRPTNLGGGVFERRFRYPLQRKSKVDFGGRVARRLVRIRR
ncbi:hypothetical protein C8F04DRAFT_1396781 [Mycena alexandri]|uniref:F-box domain-containing protein n=1 Tax=Mycena alexandri TaxID=1745969 RepID=A0AAD6SRQ1_9AGAR|nr:hypothetical protein C8F04DRAFT_1396781 [Mycena alexandri]